MDTQASIHCSASDTRVCVRVRAEAETEADPTPRMSMTKAPTNTKSSEHTRSRMRRTRKSTAQLSSSPSPTDATSTAKQPPHIQLGRILGCGAIVVDSGRGLLLLLPRRRATGKDGVCQRWCSRERSVAYPLETHS